MFLAYTVANKVVVYVVCCQMAVSCDLLTPAESYDEGSGIVFYGAYLQGAQWDVNGQCLSPSRWVVCW